MGTCEEDRRLHASVMKREAWKEEMFREERRKKDEELQLGFGATEMCQQELRKIIDSDRRVYYRTEELNDKLYIHYKGWKKIQGLDGWTGLKAMYAECNAFSKIEGLLNCRSLRSLFLQENCIGKIEGLENCPDLWNLNLSNNFIEKIEGLKHLKNLNTLTIVKNKIGFKGMDDIIELADTNITSVDIQDNLIWDPDCLPEVFARMGSLRVLYLKGNPCAKKIPNYRKNITVCCDDLRYLDDRPVFPDDRRAADAFNRGGLEEERAERRRIRDEEREKHDRNLRAFNQMIETARAEKREQAAMREEDKYTDETDPVESQERRMKRLHDQWKEEHADELKDDARENAEKRLQAEYEQAEAAKVENKENNKDAENADGNRAWSAEGGFDKKEDNRKLVYEDIWDDVPLLKESKPAAPNSGYPTPAVKSSPSVEIRASDFDTLDDIESAPAKSTTPFPQAANLVSEGGAKSELPAWYSKFAEKAGELAQSKPESETRSVPGSKRIQIVEDTGIPQPIDVPAPQAPAQNDRELQEMD